MTFQTKMRTNQGVSARSLNVQSLNRVAGSKISQQPELLEMPTVLESEGEPLRHILLGSPGGVRQTIHLLHMLRYVENALWSPLVTIPNDQLIITPRQGEVMSLLVRHLRP